MRISNLTADGSWQVLGPDQVPHKAYEVVIQARTSTDVLIANAQDLTQYLTLKAGASLSIQDLTQPGTYAVQATAGTVIEIASSARLIR